MFAQFAIAATLFCASLLPMAVQARDSAPCPLLSNAITVVKPHESSRQIGKLTVSRGDGASVFLPAQPGLSAEWLQRSVEDHFASMTPGGMKDCSLPVGAVKVSVHSRENGYWVTIQTDDRELAKDVLQGATALLHRKT